MAEHSTRENTLPVLPGGVPANRFSITKVLGETRDHFEAVARVAFATDPEGRLLEIVQMP